MHAGVATPVAVRTATVVTRALHCTGGVVRRGRQPALRADHSHGGRARGVVLGRGDSERIREMAVRTRRDCARYGLARGLRNGYTRRSDCEACWAWADGRARESEQTERCVAWSWYVDRGAVCVSCGVDASHVVSSVVSGVVSCGVLPVRLPSRVSRAAPAAGHSMNHS